MTGRPIAINPVKNSKDIFSQISDSVDFNPRPRGIIISAGAWVWVNEDDTTTTIADGELPAGQILECSPKRINATGTTLTTLKAVY